MSRLSTITASLELNERWVTVYMDYRILEDAVGDSPAELWTSRPYLFIDGHNRRVTADVTPTQLLELEVLCDEAAAGILEAA